MNARWFKRFGVVFVPSSVAGWLIFLGAVAYAVYDFIDVDSRSHSVSDTLMNVAATFAIIALVYSCIAYVTIRRADRRR